MKALVQRVSSASVTINDVEVGSIDTGMLILYCAMSGDSREKIPVLARKIAKLRIFADNAGKMNLSLADIRGSALVVSQFTLAADTSRGNRPGFSGAAPPDIGKSLYSEFVGEMRKHCTVETGEFGANMQVALVNNGPVTIWLEV